VNDTGIVTLKSGNQFRWTHIRTSGRGGITGEFLHAPTDADIEEGREISRALMPADGREAFSRVITDNSADCVLADFLTHGARNN
jgi:hypothetical protein